MQKSRFILEEESTIAKRRASSMYSELTLVQCTSAESLESHTEPIIPLRTKRENKLVYQSPNPPCLSKTEPPRSRLRDFTEEEEKSAKIIYSRDENLEIFPTSSKLTFFDQHFEKVSDLGKGSFGTVIKVRAKDSGMYSAIKYATLNVVSRKIRRAHHEEVEKHKLLKHPNILGLLSAWEERNRLYIQTELCKCSLFDICKAEDYISESRCWSYFIDVLLALDYMHSIKIIHVDIKPANILITCDGVCKLGDFGLARSINDTQNFIYLTTEGDSKYLAPDVLNDGPSKEGDIFSLGITLFELASNISLPNSGSNWHLLRKPCIPDSFKSMLSVEMSTVVLNMMNRDPQLRPTTEQLLDDLVILSKMNARQLDVYKEYHRDNENIK